MNEIAFLVYTTFLFCAVYSTYTGATGEEKDESVFFYDILNNLPDLNSHEWKSFLMSKNYCRLDGIQCDKNGHVISIELRDMKLNGSLPESIGNLAYLNRLIISNCDLKILPESLFDIKNLNELELSYNSIYSNMSEDFGKLSNLKSLDLSNNLFQGNIPNSIGNLTSLRRLYLHNNSFCGNLPSSIGNLKHLYLMDLSDNKLEGNLPQELGNLKILRRLRMRNNNFSGDASNILDELFNLNKLDLTRNNISNCGYMGCKFYSNMPMLIDKVNILPTNNTSNPVLQSNQIQVHNAGFPKNGSLDLIYQNQGLNNSLSNLNSFLSDDVELYQASIHTTPNTVFINSGQNNLNNLSTYYSPLVILVIFLYNYLF